MIAALGQLLCAWRSLRWREAAVGVLAALLFTLIDLTSLLELQTTSPLADTVALHLLANLTGAAALALCWLPAARSDPQHPQRRWRLLAATLLGSVLAVAATHRLMDVLPWRSICDLFALSKGKPDCSDFLWSDWLGHALWVSLPALLMVGLVEARQQRRHHERLAHALLLEHSQLKHQASAARLAALQARIEPDHLFAALVEIEQAYAQGRPDAGERIERLITELRQALLQARALNPR